MRFQTVQLSGFPTKSPLALELRQSIDASPGTKVVDGAAQAQVVLEALADSRDRSVVAYTSTGLVREVQLRARLNFRLRTAGGKELIPATEILQVREPVQGDAERHRGASGPPPGRGARALGPRCKYASINWPRT